MVKPAASIISRFGDALLSKYDQAVVATRTLVSLADAAEPSLTIDGNPFPRFGAAATPHLPQLSIRTHNGSPDQAPLVCLPLMLRPNKTIIVASDAAFTFLLPTTVGQTAQGVPDPPADGGLTCG